MTGSHIKSKRLRHAILNHEKYFNASEVSMAKNILKWLPYDHKWVDSVLFFKALRSRDLKSHKVHARFAITIFEMVGAQYSQL